MITLGFVLLVGLVTFRVASRSLANGIAAVMAVGYAYGLLRANVTGTATYLVFDVAIAGLYAAQAWRPGELTSLHQRNLLAMWCVLTVWPLMLFFFADGDLLVELVGLRGNVMFLPFILLGARLTDHDLRRLALLLACLNLAAFGVGAAEYVFGLEFLLPRNESTELIYRSNDLLNYTQYRIPSSFVSPHAFGGTMVMTVPLLIGAWGQREYSLRQNRLIAVALLASFVGVFMAATRVHAIGLAVLLVVTTLSLGAGMRQWLRWAMVLGLVGWVVATEARLQRFTTLADSGFVVERLSRSVNDRFLEIAGEYPLGNGLASGGTSVPFFLSERVNPLNRVEGLENEYARLVLEQGLPGLMLWLLMLFWVAVSGAPSRQSRWSLGRRLAWVAVMTGFVTGLTGIGLFTAIPQSCLWLLCVGWVVARGEGWTWSAEMSRQPQGAQSAA